MAATMIVATISSRLPGNDNNRLTSRTTGLAALFGGGMTTIPRSSPAT